MRALWILRELLSYRQSRQAGNDWPNHPFPDTVSRRIELLSSQLPVLKSKPCPTRHSFDATFTVQSSQ